MTRVIGWALWDSADHAHIFALCGDGTVVVRESFNNEWRVWGDQSLNDGSLLIQDAIESWEQRGYHRSDPLDMEISVDPSDFTDKPHEREEFDDLFRPLLDMAGISPQEPAVRTITKARLAAISVTAAPPPSPAVGDIWFDTSANGTSVYNGGSWDTMKGIS